MKKCNKCKELKDLSLFGNDKRIVSGKKGNCNSCEVIIHKEFSRTKKGLLTVMYNSQKLRCRRRGHKPPEYSLEEFRSHAKSLDKFHVLFDKWVLSGFNTNLIPSFDRKDDDVGYNISNIQIMTWEENNKKAREDVKSNKLSHSSKAVLQFNLDGVFIKEYYSVVNASSKTGICKTTIAKCCRKHIYCHSAGGYLWKYK